MAVNFNNKQRTSLVIMLIVLVYLILPFGDRAFTHKIKSVFDNLYESSKVEILSSASSTAASITDQKVIALLENGTIPKVLNKLKRSQVRALVKNPDKSYEVTFYKNHRKTYTVKFLLFDERADISSILTKEQMAYVKSIDNWYVVALFENRIIETKISS